MEKDNIDLLSFPANSFIHGSKFGEPHVNSFVMQNWFICPCACEASKQGQIL